MGEAKDIFLLKAYNKHMISEFASIENLTDNDEQNGIQFARL